MRRTLQILAEREVYVDKGGYAHDDEGNTWYVGDKYPKGIHGGSFPVPREKVTARERLGRRDEERGRLEGYKARGVIAAFDKALGKSKDRFLRSVAAQAARGKKLSPKQWDVAAKIFFRLDMDDEAKKAVPERSYERARKEAERERKARGHGRGLGDAKKREALLAVLDLALDRKDNRFLSLVRHDVLDGKALTAKQKEAVRRVLLHLGMKDEASVFGESKTSVVWFGEQSAITTGGIHSLDTRATHYPHPFMFPILMKPSTVPAGEVKAQAACLKATRAYTQGSITKKQLDRICSGFKE